MPTCALHHPTLIPRPQTLSQWFARQPSVLNGVYTQNFNRLHQRVGHVFQGRFKAILVEKDGYLLELSRYVVLNPLRAGGTLGRRGARMVRKLEAWPWSSYLATCGVVAAPAWLQTDFILKQFSAQRARAITKYITFVHEGKGLPSVWDQLQGQIYLGSTAFVEKMQAEVDKQPKLFEVPRAQRRALKRELTEYAAAHPRNDAVALAYLSGQHTMAAIATHFGVHYTTVSRLVKVHEGGKAVA